MPDALSRVIGQPIASALLERALKSGRLSHAYLFVGPPGTGKRTMALALAEHLLGKSAQDHPDFRLWAPENKSGTIAIDQIRDLIDSCNTPPLMAPYQVRVIDQAEGLAKDSGNALLKILEEPPPQTVLILLAEQFDHILPTLVSRAQVVPFRPVAESVIAETLIARGCDPETARVRAAQARGRIGQALSDDEVGSPSAWPGDGPRDRLAWVNEGSAHSSQELAHQLSLWQRQIWHAHPHPSQTSRLRAIDEAVGQLERNANARLVLEKLAATWGGFH